MRTVNAVSRLRCPPLSLADRAVLAAALMFAALAAVSTLAGCGGRGDEGGGRSADRATEVVDVFVSIAPQQYFVQRIGGPRVTVDVMVPPGESPHTYSPSPRKVVALGGSDIYFTLGLPFETRLIEKIRGVGPDLMIVSADRGIDRRRLEDHGHGHFEEEHAADEPGLADETRAGDEAHHEDEAPKGEPDPHIWLGPDNIARIARNTRDGLVRAAPAYRSEFDGRLAELLEDIESVDRRIHELMDPYEGRRVLVFHPAFGYFTDAYGLEQIAIEIEGKSPTPRQLEALIGRARRENVRIIFVQAQFDRTAAEKVAEAIDGAVVPLDPLSPDVLANLREIADRIAAALE